MGGVLLVSLEQGLIFSLLAIGVVFTFKILDIADLSVEGTFPLGAFVLAKFLTNGMDPILAIIISFLAGAVGGFITFVLYKKLKIQPILAGILNRKRFYLKLLLIFAEILNITRYMFHLFLYSCFVFIHNYPP